MTELPPILRDQRRIDADHLRLLAIFHFVVAGLALIGIGFLCLHYAFMNAIINNPEMWKNQKSGSLPPEQFFALFKWFYLFFGALLMVGGIGNLLSGLFIQKRKNRTFSLIIAGVNCIQVPFGTVLGVFTFIVLLRDSVCEMYEAKPSDIP